MSVESSSSTLSACFRTEASCAVYSSSHIRSTVGRSVGNPTAPLLPAACTTAAAMPEGGTGGTGRRRTEPKATGWDRWRDGCKETGCVSLGLVEEDSNAFGKSRLQLGESGPTGQARRPS